VKRIHLLPIVFVLVYVVVHKSNNISYVPTTKKNVKGKLGVVMTRVKFHHHEMLELFEPRRFIKIDKFMWFAIKFEI
jgi:hypothetical protein